MKIRRANIDDIPSIVQLLKASLGESLMPKSEAYWRWKHLDNPFGPSPVILAEADDQLVGVRAFLRWNWRVNDRVLRTVRAVDTATHPDYQGKGIFKKLTLQLVDECQREGCDFIFNTPNSNSRPGYLKMGWKDAGRLPIRLKLGNPFGWIGSRKSASDANESLAEMIDRMPETSLLAEGDEHAIRTDASKDYLRWRYCAVPVVQYSAIRNLDGSQLLIYRLKEGRFGTEMRITDYFGNTNPISEDLLALINDRAHATRAAYVAAAGTGRGLEGGLVIKRGPMVTVRKLNYATDSLSNFTHWRPTIGDLELF